MKRKHSNRNLILLTLLLLVMVIIFFALPSVKLTGENQSVEGTWDFYCYYSNDTSLIYRGDLTIGTEDTLTAVFEIFAPRSTRPEMIRAASLSMEAGKLSGILVHDRYMIKGGHMHESFELTFDKEEPVFRGEGRCLQHCAEGTESSVITWYGSKQETTIQ